MNLWFFAIVGMTVVGVIADYFLKSASNTSIINWKFFAVGFIIYASTALGWFIIMRHTKLATLGAVYAVSITLLLALVGLIFFKEKLNMIELIGLALGVLSLLLLARFA